MKVLPVHEFHKATKNESQDYWEKKTMLDLRKRDSCERLIGSLSSRADVQSVSPSTDIRVYASNKQNTSRKEQMAYN